EGQVLTVFRQLGLDVAQRRARQRGEGELAGLVFGDAAELGEVEDRCLVLAGHERFGRRLRPRAAHADALVLAHELLNLVDARRLRSGHSREIVPSRSSGCRPCIASDGASAPGNIFPRLATSRGSIAWRMRFIASTSLSPNICAKNCRFSMPTPCSP